MDRPGGGANVGVSGIGREFCGGGGFPRGTRGGIAFLGAELLARGSRSGSENSVVVEGIDDDSFAVTESEGVHVHKYLLTSHRICRLSAVMQVMALRTVHNYSGLRIRREVRHVT